MHVILPAKQIEYLIFSFFRLHSSGGGSVKLLNRQDDNDDDDGVMKTVMMAGSRVLTLSRSGTINCHQLSSHHHHHYQLSSVFTARYHSSL